MIIWHSGRQWAGIAADKLRIGVEGAPYAFDGVTGPHYPRARDYDWTQDGRSCADLILDMTTTEWLDLEHTNRALG
ncbi:hypothetical protein [Nocardia testacea]|uniref:hypothetical protein n=1 Tax=Nocardia testacea TaxID=248551 RepID=UPI0033F9457C